MFFARSWLHCLPAPGRLGRPPFSSRGQPGRSSSYPHLHTSLPPVSISEQAGLNCRGAGIPSIAHHVLSPQVHSNRCGINWQGKARSRTTQEETQNLWRKQLGQRGGLVSNGCEGRASGSGCSPNTGREKQDPERSCQCPRPRPEATAFLLPDPGVREFPDPRIPGPQHPQRPSRSSLLTTSHSGICPASVRTPPWTEPHYLTRPFLPLTC